MASRSPTEAERRYLMALLPPGLVPVGLALVASLTTFSAPGSAHFEPVWNAKTEAQAARIVLRGGEACSVHHDAVNYYVFPRPLPADHVVSALASLSWDGYVREEAIGALAADRSELALALVAARTADWVEVVRLRAESLATTLVGDAPPPLLVANKALLGYVRSRVSPRSPTLQAFERAVLRQMVGGDAPPHSLPNASRRRGLRAILGELGPAERRALFADEDISVRLRLAEDARDDDEVRLAMVDRSSLVRLAALEGAPARDPARWQAEIGRMAEDRSPRVRARALSIGSALEDVS